MATIRICDYCDTKIEEDDVSAATIMWYFISINSKTKHSTTWKKSDFCGKCRILREKELLAIKHVDANI